MRSANNGNEADLKPAVLNSRNASVNKVQRSFRRGRLSEGRASNRLLPGVSDCMQRTMGSEKIVDMNIFWG